MQTVSNTTRLISDNQASSQDRDFTDSFTREDTYQEIIKKAETVPLTKIFSHYKVRIDQFNRKCGCPFPKHKGGREATASFYYYPETNTFWCFGCKTGTNGVDFVASIERINKSQAALKIVNLFNGDLKEDYDNSSNDSYQDKSDLWFDFSKIMNQMISKGCNLEEMESIYKIFDKMNDKYELDLAATESLITKLKVRLENIK